MVMNNMKLMWTTDKDQSITFCSYNIYYNSNVYTKTFVSMCIYVVKDLIEQSKPIKIILHDCT